MAVLREAERTSILIKEIFLLEADPEIRIVYDRGARVGRVRRAIRVHHFVQHDIPVFAAGIGIERHRFQNAVGAFAFGLHRGAAVKTPIGNIGQRGGFSKDFNRVLPRSSGTGCLPSSQMYSNLYLVMVVCVTEFRFVTERINACGEIVGSLHSITHFSPSM